MSARTPITKLKEAARARFYEGLPWSVCAGHAGLTESGLRKMRGRRDPDWLQAVEEIVAEMEDEGLATAYGCLVRMATLNDVAAARTLLERYRAAKIEIEDGRTLQDMTDEELDAEIARLQAQADARQAEGE